MVSGDSDHEDLGLVGVAEGARVRGCWGDMTVGRGSRSRTRNEFLGKSVCGGNRMGGGTRDLLEVMVFFSWKEGP